MSMVIRWLMLKGICGYSMMGLCCVCVKFYRMRLKLMVDMRL